MQKHKNFINFRADSSVNVFSRKSKNSKFFSKDTIERLNLPFLTSVSCTFYVFVKFEILIIYQKPLGPFDKLMCRDTHVEKHCIKQTKFSSLSYYTRFYRNLYSINIICYEVEFMRERDKSDFFF